jgi:hypothetical protein
VLLVGGDQSRVALGGKPPGKVECNRRHSHGRRFCVTTGVLRQAPRCRIS